jgi:hypothetical protein
LPPDACEITALLNPCPAPEPQALWRFAPHEQDYTGVKRLRPTRRRLRRMARPLLLELRLKNPCWRLRRIFEG